MGTLEGKKIAILIDDGYERVETEQAKKALEKAGAQTRVISPRMGNVMSWDKTDWGKKLKVDAHLFHAAPEFFDALLLPGGIMSADKLRTSEEAVIFISHFKEFDKPIAAMGHGIVPMIETGWLSGKKITSAPSLKTDLKNAGAIWNDKNVVQDNGLITSRSVEDIDVFIDEMIAIIGGGKSVL